MRTKDKFSQKGWIYPVIITVVGFCYYISFFNYGINLGDEGYVVYGAERVLQGQLPMSDFMSYPPGSYFLIALLFKVFGVNLLVSRLMEMTFLIINGLLVFYVGKRLMPERWALIPSFILIMFPGFWHKVFFQFGMLLSLVMLLRFLERKTIVRILCVGWAVGIALVFKIEAAPLSSITILVVLFCYHIWKNGVFSINKEALLGFLKELTLFSLAVLSILIPVLIYYYYQSDLIKLFNWLMEGYGPDNIGWVKDNFGKPSLLKTLTKFHIGNLKNLFFYLIVLLWLYGFGKVIIYFLIQKGKDFPFLLPVVVMGMSFLAYFYISFTQYHLLQSAPMAYILFVFIIYSSVQKKGVKSNVVLFILVLILGLYLLNSFKMKPYFGSGSISRLYVIRKEGARFISLSKAKIYLSKKDFDDISGLVKYFEGKDGYLMPLYYEGMVNFLTGLQNPTQFSILTPYHLNSVSKQRQVIDEVERYKIKYLLISRMIWTSQENLGFDRYAPILYEFVTGHYQLEKEIAGYLIFSRQSFQNCMIQGRAER